MDDDARAELAALRRRAYGPAPDIATDPAAMSRLRELEDLARSERMPAAGDDDDAHVAAAVPVPEPAEASSGTSGAARGAEDAAPAAADEPAPQPEGPPAADDAGDRRPSWARRPGVLVGLGLLALAAVGLVLTGLDALREPTVDADPMPTAFPASARVIDRVELFGPLGNGLRVTVSDTWPDIPVSGAVDWSASLGTYYGWDLWVMGVDTEAGKEHCLALERRGRVRFECDPVDQVAQGTLHLLLSIDAVPTALRPEAADVLDVHWSADGAVTISAVAGGG